jgi:hypothetical protein
VVDLGAEVKIRAFEAERLAALLEEARAATQAAVRESEKQARKVEVGPTSFIHFFPLTIYTHCDFVEI